MLEDCTVFKSKFSCTICYVWSSFTEKGPERVNVSMPQREKTTSFLSGKRSARLCLVCGYSCRRGCVSSRENAVVCWFTRRGVLEATAVSVVSEMDMIISFCGCEIDMTDLEG